MKDIQRIRPLTTGPIESSVRSRQAETSALVQSTPYPKPRQQLISRTPKKSPLPFLVRQLIIKQELPRNKYQDHVNNTKTILIYHVGLFVFLFITTSTQLHREFVMTTLGKRWNSAPIIIHEENRIAEIRAKIGSYIIIFKVLVKQILTVKKI
ncbi:hypothetical protein C2G38_87275 [Gigaspora rosea]|uniref:Uncharacterized protein n=1 Tax=Gigaspora rosea TaxID=44941 RepID=A0A397USH4_9GLOM|nr:hypothetical protein C2G38_87275 [Gigaspora rosea]